MNQNETNAGRFDVMIASDQDHEKVYAEIYFDGKFVALISQERGITNKSLELPGPGLVEDLICREVDLAGFLQAVQQAARKLEDEKSST